METLIDQDLPLVYADPMRIRQVLLNLLSNAVKFTSSGLVRTRVRQNANTLIISITDSGIGIKSEEQTAIFNRFHRIDSPVARKSGGTELGLPISKHLIEQHGGQLWLKSEFGKGSIFYFSLPLRGDTNENFVR